MRPFSLLVKPAAADCNLSCDYCFYLRKSRLYPDTRRHRMTGDVLERVIASYLATEQSAYSFAWQGGEPTLMGVEFFRAVTELQTRYGRHGASVANSLQTNGTLLDDTLAAHLARYRFLVGVSLDGPAEIHDRQRRTAGGAPSHADVLRGIATLKRHDVEFNIVVLVSQANVRRAREVYRYLRAAGFRHHQYVPCVEFDDRGQPRPHSIDGEEWGGFLRELFDTWVERDSRRVSIREFDSILLRLLRGRPAVCTAADDCRQYLVVEHNGDIYPCDFFVESELLLGNVLDTGFTAALESPAYHEFGRRKARWPAACARCPHLDLCAGDCVKNRVAASGGRSWLCTGLRAFFDHSRPRFERLAGTLRREQTQPCTDTHCPPAGRNAPCPCGSGLKYKKCCGRR